MNNVREKATNNNISTFKVSPPARGIIMGTSSFQNVFTSPKEASMKQIYAPAAPKKEKKENWQDQRTVVFPPR